MLKKINSTKILVKRDDIFVLFDRTNNGDCDDKEKKKSLSVLIPFHLNSNI